MRKTKSLKLAALLCLGCWDLGAKLVDLLGVFAPYKEKMNEHQAHYTSWHGMEKGTWALVKPTVDFCGLQNPQLIGGKHIMFCRRFWGCSKCSTLPVVDAPGKTLFLVSSELWRRHVKNRSVHSDTWYTWQIRCSMCHYDNVQCLMSSHVYI